MATTDVTKTGETSPAPTHDLFENMRNEMSRMIERFEHGANGWPSVFSAPLGHSRMLPKLDVHDDGTKVMIEADLPGVDEKDVAVLLANGVLTIKGEKESAREEKKDDYYLSERGYGSFERSVRLPDTVDENDIKAKFDKRVLKIVAKKRPEAVKAARKIAIEKD